MSRYFFYIFSVFLMVRSVASLQHSTTRSFLYDGNRKDRRGLISPRVEYNEWTPLGRSDPLRNDPTFDYSPPMLDKVKYWMNTGIEESDSSVIQTPESESTSSTSTTPKVLKSYYYKSDAKRYHTNYHKGMPLDFRLSQKVNNIRFPSSQNGPFLNYNSKPIRAPLPMLVPPPAVDVNTYAPTYSTKLETESPKYEEIVRLETTALSNISSIKLPAVTESTDFINTVTINDLKLPTTSERSSFLHSLLGKEFVSTLMEAKSTSTERPSVEIKHHLIMQGHSKVKKYGPSKLETLSPMLLDSNEIGKNLKTNEIKKREYRQLKVEDLLPFDVDTFDEALSDFVQDQAEGSGYGSIITRVIFPQELLTPRPSSQPLNSKVKQKKKVARM